MESRERKAWFSAKRQPCSWQGWTVFLAFMISIFLAAFLTRKTESFLLSLVIFICPIVLLETARRLKSDKQPGEVTKE